MRHDLNGMSLPELLIAMAMMVIIVSMLASSFQSLTGRYNSRAIINDLNNYLHYVRAEALSRGHPVSLCPSANTQGTLCGQDWSQGWIVFDNPLNAALIGNNTILRTYSFAQRNQVFSWTQSPNPLNIITYLGNGFIDPPSAQHRFTIAPLPCSTDDAQSLFIDASGSLSMSVSLCP